MKRNVLQIKELKINEDDRTGVELISFVESPAIQENFEFFKYDIPDILPFFKFTAAPDTEIIDTSHPFCKEHAGRVYHDSEINEWSTLNHNNKDDYYYPGWIQESNFFQTFDGKTSTDFSGSQQLYNCRHTLRRVTSMSEVPRSKWKYLNLSSEDTGDIYLTLQDEEKRIVRGCVLVSGKMIFRTNCDGLGNPGYVFFSRETVRLAQKKYGYNRSISVNHKEDKTGSAILLNSWLEEDEENKVTRWFTEYKIIGEELWDYVKSKKVLGFSVESLFSF